MSVERILLIFLSPVFKVLVYSFLCAIAGLATVSTVAGGTRHLVYAASCTAVYTILVGTYLALSIAALFRFERIALLKFFPQAVVYLFYHFQFHFTAIGTLL